MNRIKIYEWPGPLLEISNEGTVTSVKITTLEDAIALQKSLVSFIDNCNIGSKRVNKKKSFLCFIGIHKSNKDYGIRWHDNACLSHCVKCKTQIVHRSFFSN
jgi:hypothetical protein